MQATKAFERIIRFEEVEELARERDELMVAWFRTFGDSVRR